MELKEFIYLVNNEETVNKLEKAGWKWEKDCSIKGEKYTYISFPLICIDPLFFLSKEYYRVFNGVGIEKGRMMDVEEFLNIYNKKSEFDKLKELKELKNSFEKEIKRLKKLINEEEKQEVRN